MEMKKVIFDCRMISSSGIGVYSTQIINQLKNDHDLSLTLLIKQCQKSHISSIYPNLNLEVTKYNRFDIRNIIMNNDILNKYDCYVIPFLSITPAFLKNVDIISTVHDLCPVSLKRIFGFKVGVTYWLLLLQQLFISNKIIAISKFTKKQINTYYYRFFEKKISVIYNGANEITTSRLALRENNIGIYGLIVGNVKPHKNIIPLVNYFNKNIAKMNFKIIIVGQVDGFTTGIDAKNILSTKNILFTGKVSDEELGFYYQHASFFIYPSLYEGFGLPLLEAMKYKLKIFASDIEVFREIAKDKVSYFNPYDFNGLIDDILFFLKKGDCYSCDYSEILPKYNWDITGLQVKKLILS